MAERTLFLKGRARKGQLNLLMWFPRVVVVFLSLLIMVLLLNHYLSFNANISNLEHDIYRKKILLAESIHAKKPLTERTDYNTISLEDYTTENLDSEIWYDRNLPEENLRLGRLAANLTLYDADMNKKKTIYNDEELFRRYEPKASADIEGEGGATMKTTLYPTFYVSRKKGEYNKKQGFLKIVTVRPNS